MTLFVCSIFLGSIVCSSFVARIWNRRDVVPLSIWKMMENAKIDQNFQFRKQRVVINSPFEVYECIIEIAFGCNFGR